MRQHGSLLLLFARHTQWKILLLLALGAAAEGGILALGPDPQTVSLSEFLAHCLNWMGPLTLLRLPVAPSRLILWQGVYNTLAYLLFWAVQALGLVGACWYYAWRGGDVGPQSFYLAVWESPFFHGFLPLGFPIRWVRNLLLALGLGFTGACFTEASHRSRHNVAFFILAGCTLLFFLTGVSLPLILLSLLCLFLGLLSLWQAGKESYPHETDLS